MKIDLAIQSYKKPESLIYTLFTLHEHCKESIETVWINDDKSGGDVLDCYRKLQKTNALHPWKIKIRENKHRMGWWVSFVRGYNPLYLNWTFKLKRILWNLYKTHSAFVQEDDTVTRQFGGTGT